MSVESKARNLNFGVAGIVSNLKVIGSFLGSKIKLFYLLFLTSGNSILNFSWVSSSVKGVSGKHVILTVILTFFESLAEVLMATLFSSRRRTSLSHSTFSFEASNLILYLTRWPRATTFYNFVSGFP